MKKGLKKFLIVCVVTVLCFITSFVIQYYIVAETTMRIMMAIAIWCALLGAMFVLIIDTISNSNWGKANILLWILMIFAIMSMVFFLSTIGNPIINNIGLNCFFISFILLVVYCLYETIKELIKLFKK